MRIQSRFARLARWLIVPAILAGLLGAIAPSARADGDVTQELNKQQDKLKWLQDQMAQAQNDFQRANLKAAQAQVQLDQVTKDLTDANRQLAVLTNQLVTAQKDLAKTQADLKIAQDNYDKKRALLSTRIRSISEEGRVSYLAVLFGATTFSDFLNRFEMLKVIVQNDATLFTQIRKDKQDLEDKQAAAIKRKSDLEILQAQAADRKNQAEAKKVQQEQITNALVQSKRALQAQLDQNDAQQQAVRDQIDMLVMSQNRQGGAFSPAYPVRPVDITDPYGMRLHPILGIYRMHWGTDFAANYGQAVYAIEAGTVVRAGWDDAYGNLVVIDHGGGYSSWYGHAQKLLVHEGQVVKRGQQITEAGSTGWATGPHVHLEIHVNGKAVDPMTLLPK